MQTAAPMPLTRRTAPVAVIFTLTIFLSASLLFSVQPLFTKLVLPAIGGAPAVWTTAMLFFQIVLIGGYLYAHLVTRYLDRGWQVALHLGLWALALVFLPLALPKDFDYNPAGDIALQTLWIYALGVGVPFAVLSANAPLIQSWYRHSGGPSAEDPYFLYGASNLGSLASLLAFPLLAEPFLGMGQVGKLWAWGFALLGAALLVSGLMAGRGPGGSARSSRSAPNPAAEAEAEALPAPGAGALVWWILLAFIPSSLMLGITTKISTDVGSFPLVWVLPLALYLLTFVLGFTDRPLLSDRQMPRLMIASLCVLATLAAAGWLGEQSLSAAGLLVLSGFGVMWVVHRRLYLARPAAQHLTLFYVIMSVGGALGGLFNSILAPMIFDSFAELRVTLALAGLLLLVPGLRISPRDLAMGLVLGVVVMLPVILGNGPLAGLPAWALGAASILALGLGLWQLRANGVAGAALLASALFAELLFPSAPAMLTDRSFFGPHQVKEVDGIRYYLNGTTVHGAVALDQLAAPRPRPTSYYSESGGMGQILSSARAQKAGRIGVVGLGVGSLACYRQPGQEWHFYEIDRKVDEIARDPSLFTFMSSCAADVPTHLGDARIVLAGQGDLRFDVLVIDAYSSDAVPLHLSTTEALALYRDRLAPGGLLVLHVSNRFYRIDQALARGAAALGMPAMMQIHDPGKDAAAGVKPSQVVVMAARAEDLADLAQDGRWQVLQSDGKPAWSDDFANLLSVLK